MFFSSSQTFIYHRNDQFLGGLMEMTSKSSGLFQAVLTFADAALRLN